MNDLISRQDAIDALTEENLFKHMDTVNDGGQENRSAIRIIKSLPSAQPERKKGKWLWNLADNGWADHTCSECGWVKNTDIHVALGYNYCPNCGTDMRQREETNE